MLKVLLINVHKCKYLPVSFIKFVQYEGRISKTKKNNNQYIFRLSSFVLSSFIQSFITLLIVLMECY